MDERGNGTMMKKYWVFFAVIPLLFPSNAHAVQSPYYVAQSSAGSANGTSCGNAYSVATFNSAGSWGSGSTQIGAGTVVHFCGAITTALNIQGSGTSGNVIEFLWESGARISLPDGQIVNLVNGNNAFLLFDGGVACGPGTTCDTTEAANMTGYASGQAGIIEATANGSGLANQNSQTQAFAQCNGCHDIEIRNIIIRNMYQHTSTTDYTSSADTGNFVFQCPGGNGGCTSGTISIHDASIHDTGNSISIQLTSSTHINIFNIDWYRNNWVMEYSGSGSRYLRFYNNHIHDTANWDTNTQGACGPNNSCFHHNGIHAYMNTGETDSLLFDVYNNTIDGDWGNCCTTNTLLYTEVTGQANSHVFNNVVIQKSGNTSAPFVSHISGPSGVFANNTLVGVITSGNATSQFDFSLSGSMTIENNVISGYSQYIYLYPSPLITTWDYNIYGTVGGGGNPPWQWQGGTQNTFSAWQSACSCDSNGQNPASIGVNSVGVPQAGSPLIGAGNNLTSICNGQPNPGLGALCSDISGTARPGGTTKWDVGAFQFSRGPSLSNSPTSIAFGNQPTGSSSAAQAVVVTNGGAASATISSCTITGTNANQFSITDPASCPSTLGVNASFTIHVNFSPTATGAQSANLTITDTPDSISSSTALTGTGTTTAPVLVNNPTSIAFGNQADGTTSGSQTVTVQNTGTATATITSCTITGTNSNQFAVSGSCPASLTAGNSFNLTVTFSPTSAGSKTATLTITDTPDSLTSTTSLTGTGIAPAPVFSLSPSSSACGTSNLGVKVTCPTMTLTNTGNATATISSKVVGGTNSSSFSETDTCGGTLAANATCVFTPSMTPATAGSLTGTITITDTPDGINAVGNLSGTGVNPNAPTILNINVCASHTSTSPCTIVSTTAGSILIEELISAFGSEPTVSSVTDSASESWAEAVDPVTSQTARSVDNSSTSMGDIWYKANVQAGVTTVTTNMSATSTIACVIYEVTGLSGVDTVKVANSQASSANPSGPAITTTKTSAEFVVSFLNPQTSVTSIFGGNVFTNDSLTFSAGWAHYITNTMGTFTPEWTLSGSGTSNSSAAAFYKAPSSVNSPSGVSIKGAFANGTIH